MTINENIITYRSMLSIRNKYHDTYDMQIQVRGYVLAY